VSERLVQAREAEEVEEDALSQMDTPATQWRSASSIDR